MKMNTSHLAKMPFLFALVFFTSLSYAQVIYVNTNATGSNDGTTWANAFTSLQSALDASQTGDEIWVAAGTYKPSVYPAGCSGCSTDRDFSFLLKNGVNLYGGFAGTETQLSQRNGENNETILSGDFNGDDVIEGSGESLEILNNSENALHVVLAVSINDTTVLDGFTITGGRANKGGNISVASQSIINQSGGGLYNRQSSAIRISNITFVGNWASSGAGMTNHQSSPSIKNIKFIKNQATGGGGGIYNQNSSPNISNALFRDNAAIGGGQGSFGGAGIWNRVSSPRIVNCTFINNWANANAGGITNLGNFSFSQGFSFSNPIIINSILWNNGNEISNILGYATISYSVVQGSTNTNNNNLNIDPTFIDPNNNDFRLDRGSLAVNAGSNTAYENTLGNDLENDTDLNGHTRRFQSRIDIGAYEADFKQSQWRGTVDNHWDKDDNWDEEVPDNETVALVIDLSLNTPRILPTTNGEVNFLSINEDAILEVNGILKAFDRLDNKGEIHFLSNSENTGQLDEFSGVLSGNGLVKVERFIPQSNRAFRYISSPVNTITSINANLQEGATNTDADPNPNPGYGTHITGGSPQDGFDVTETNNPSMFTWDEASQEWSTVPNTNIKTMQVGEAYALMVRGDRSTDLTSNTSLGPATTLQFVGDLHFGDYAVPSSDLASQPEQWNLVANPYQALVNLKTLLQSSDATDLDENYIYIYDPTIGTRGGYATVDLSLDNPTSTPHDAELGGVTDANENLLPNQSFFVKTTGPSPSLTFKESHKNVYTNAVTTFSTGNELAKFNINLWRQPENTLVDGLTANLDTNYSNQVNADDAEKIWNHDEWLAIFNSDHYLAIEKRAIPQEGEKIQLYTGNYKSNTYTWQIVASNIEGEAVLYDAYLETETALNTNAGTYIDFQVDESNPESIDPFRFSIQFKEQSLSTEEQLNSKVMVYPNPVTNNIFSIRGLATTEDASLKLRDVTGRVVYSSKINANEGAAQVEVDHFLPDGIYHLSIQQNQAVYHIKLQFKR